MRAGNTWDSTTIPDNSPQGAVYAKPIVLASSTRIKARVFLNEQWSPVTEAAFAVPTSPELAISEIMYHPPDSEDISGTRLEFIELRNVGAGVVLTWHNRWTLQSSEDLHAWADVLSTGSPFHVSIGAEPIRFCRLRHPQPLAAAKAIGSILFHSE